LLPNFNCMQMKKNYLISVCALLLVGATSMMTAGAQTGKPKLAVFVVGMQTDALGNNLATQIAAELNRNSRYTVATGEQAAQAKLTDLRAQSAGDINRNALAAWGRTNGISTICLVTDAIKGSDHMFYAHLIDTKDSKVSGRGSYIRTGIVEGDLPRVSLALAQQLDGPGRRRSAPAPARSYPAELDIEMVRVEGGTFTMGCTPEQEAYCDAREKPTHSVTLSSFYIGKYIVTQAQWKAVMTGVAGTSAADVGEIYTFKAGKCGNVPCDDQRPAENMDWFEAVTFCNELSKRVGLQEVYTITGSSTSKTVTWDATKKGYRLPTEAEWEYAARGCRGDGSGGNAVCENLLCSGGSDPNEVGWHYGNSSSTTHPVGQKKPNALSIYDMSGNVWEWVYDWYEAYSNAAVINPTGPTINGSNRVIRGGGWGDSGAAGWLRVAIRSPWNTPSNRGNNIGFRLALPAQ
jgi:formylglycine-generating enzyme required for sulfatase activity